MKIIIAPDSFKENLTAAQVASCIEHGFRQVFPEADLVRIPMADGGEGTLNCFHENLSLSIHHAEVNNALHQLKRARYGILRDNRTAIIESAEAIGLAEIPSEDRNILAASSYGVGELILSALNQGCRKFIIGLGGTATCDGGMGALSILGVKFFDAFNHELSPGGENLQKVSRLETADLDPRLIDCEFILAHDVASPLLGLEGALRYTPQKGATPEQVEILHKGLEQFHFVLAAHLGYNIGELPGTGAAGGLAAGLLALLQAKLEPGVNVIAEYIGFMEKLESAELVITGEGKMDEQSIMGKTPVAIAKLSKQLKLPVIAFVAILDQGYEAVFAAGIDAVFSIAPGPLSKEESMASAKTLLVSAAYNVAKLLKIGGNI